MHSGGFLALLHEAVLRGTGKWLAVRTHCLGGTGVGLALLHEGRLRRAVERLAVFANRFAVTGLLRQGRTHGERRNHRS